MIQISLCMIVKNEEDVFARCLDSVRDLVDEIIIVDTGSTDTTCEIARQYTDSLYSFPWVDDFAAARNFSFAQASMEYILWLDADDVLLEKDRQQFLHLKETLVPSVDMVMMDYQIAFDNQGNPTFSYYRERLLRREAGYQWVGAVHEVIPPSGTVIYSPIAVTHRKLHPSDPDRNLRIFEKMLARGESLDPRQQFYYARELSYHQRYEEAIDCLNRFLDEGNGWVENKISACLDLSSWYRQTRQKERSLHALLRSFMYDRPRAEVCCALGAYFLGECVYPQAVFWYQLAAALQPSGKGGFESADCYAFLPYIQLCVCYDRMGNREKALEYHEKAKKIKPQDAAVLHNEAYFYHEKGPSL